MYAVKQPSDCLPPPPHLSLSSSPRCIAVKYRWSIYLSIFQRHCRNVNVPTFSFLFFFSFVLRGSDREITSGKSVKRAWYEQRGGKEGKPILRVGQVLREGVPPREAKRSRGFPGSYPQGPGSSRDRGDTNLLLFKSLSFLLFRAPRSREERRSFCSFAGLRSLSPGLWINSRASVFRSVSAAASRARVCVRARARAYESAYRRDAR